MDIERIRRAPADGRTGPLRPSHGAPRYSALDEEARIRRGDSALAERERGRVVVRAGRVLAIALLVTGAGVGAASVTMRSAPSGANIAEAAPEHTFPRDFPGRAASAPIASTPLAPRAAGDVFQAPRPPSVPAATGAPVAAPVPAPVPAQRPAAPQVPAVATDKSPTDKSPVEENRPARPEQWVALPDEPRADTVGDVAAAEAGEPVEEAPVPAPPRLAAGGYSLQFGAFRDRENAARLKAALEDKVTPVMLDEGQASGGGAIYYVRGGAFETRDSASLTSRELQKTHRIDSFVRPNPEG